MSKKDQLNIKDYVFDFVYGMAVNDAMNRVSNPGDKKVLLEEGEEIKNIIKKYAQNIVSDGDGDGKKFTETVECILKKAKGIEKKHRWESQSRQYQFLTFGKVQKLINMTMKYLYIRDCENEERKNNYVSCYAPMDSIMINYVYEIFRINKLERNLNFNKGCAWSKLKWEEQEDKNSYYSFQNAIECINRERNPSMSRIEFDYYAWEKAKTFKEDIEKEKDPDKRKEIHEKAMSEWMNMSLEIQTDNIE